MKSTRLFLRRLTFTGMTVLVLLAGILAAAEGWLRLGTCLGQAPTVNPYVAHPNLGWIGRPSTEVRRSQAANCVVYRYNRLGFRGPDFSFTKPSDTLRVLVLGDSFVEGYQFNDDELLTAKMQDILREKTGRRVEVINLGISGWGTAQELLAYQRVGRHFNPDVVLLFFSTCNDIIDASEVLSGIYHQKLRLIKPYFTLSNDELRLHPPSRQRINRINRKISVGTKYAQTKPWETVPKKAAWLCHSRVGYWFWTRWDRPSRLRLLLDKWGISKYEKILHSTTWGEHGHYRDLSLRFWIYSSRPDALWRSTLRTEMRLLMRLARTVELNQGKFLLVSGANVEQVESDIWELTMRLHPDMGKWDLDLDLPEKTINEVCRAGNINSYSLLPGFRKTAREGKSLFFREDGHWNEAGQTLAAEAVAEYLYRHGYVAPAN